MQIKNVNVTMYCNKESKIKKTEPLQTNRKSQICDTEKTASGGMIIETE